MKEFLTPTIPVEFNTYDKPRGFLYFGDQHLSSLNPGRRRPGYSVEILNKIAQGVEIANKLKLVPVFAGDLYDSAHEKADYLKSSVNELAAATWTRWIMHKGNHDQAGSRLSLSDSLSVLLTSGLVLPTTPFYINSETGESVALDETRAVCMYEMENGQTVLIGSSPYGREIPTDVRSLKEQYGADKVLWMTHHDLAFEGAYSGATEPYEIPGCAVVLNGHMHLYKDPMEFGETIYCNFGSLARTSIDAINEKPSVFSITFEPDQPGANFMRYPLKVSDPEDVFIMTGRQIDAASITFDDVQSNNFIEAYDHQLHTGLAKTDSGEVFKDVFGAHMRDLNLNVNVTSELNDLLNEVTTPSMNP